MKTSLLFLTTVGFITPAFALDKVMPEPFPEERYQEMDERSPFGLATPVAAPVVPDKSFADGWYLAGVAQVDGKDYVSVRSRDLSVQFALYGDERNDNGVKLQNVEWSPTFGRTSATIEKDGQFAKIELLNQTEMTAAGAAGAVNPGAMARPGSIAAPGVTRPTGALAYPQPNAQPQQRNIIPRPSGQPITPAAPTYQITPGLAPKAGAQPAAPAAAPTGEGRRRIRVVPPAPGQ